MKKLLTILILTTILTTSLLCVGVCFAAENDLYQASAPVQLFQKPELTSANFFIPSTYFVKIDKSATFDGDFQPVIYNKQTFYINNKKSKKLTNLTKFTKAVDEEKNPTCYTVADLQLKDATTKITIQKDGAEITLQQSAITKITFYGFNTISDKQFYFTYVENKITTEGCYTNILASDTTAPTLTLATTPKHPSAIAEESNAPSITNPDGTTPQATNSLVRNILIGVICALSIIVVFLIFKPSKKNKQKYNANQPYDNRNNGGNNNYPDNY